MKPQKGISVLTVCTAYFPSVMQWTILLLELLVPDICHRRTDGVYGEKSVMWKNFRFLYICHGEKSNFSTCGLISNFFTWHMWRNLKSPSLCVQFMVSCCIIHCFVAKFDYFLAIYAVLSQTRFLQFTRFCEEKNLAQNSVCGEKMTNIRYGVKEHRAQDGAGAAIS